MIHSANPKVLPKANHYFHSKIYFDLRDYLKVEITERISMKIKIMIWTNGHEYNSRD